jgi:hypothetical protein
MFFEWMGVVFLAIIAFFIPRTILAIVSWNVLEYQLETAIILVILTFLAIISDLYAMR